MPPARWRRSGPSTLFRSLTGRADPIGDEAQPAPAVVAVLVVGAIGVDRIVDTEHDPKVQTSSDGIAAGGWERLPDGPLSGRVGATAVWNGEEVVVVGGSTYLCPPNADCGGPVDPPFSDGAAYDPSTREWRPIAPAPAAFDGEGAVVVASDVYFLVSCAIERFTADDLDACPTTDGDVAFTRYDADADEWTLLDPPPTGRDYGLASVGRFIVAFTGSDERGEAPDLLFDTESSTWQEIPDDPMPAVFDRTVVSSAEGEALILVGAPTAGLADPAQDNNAVARFDLASRTWEALPSPPGRGYRGWGVDDRVVLEPHFGGHGGSLDPPRTRGRSCLQAPTSTAGRTRSPVSSAELTPSTRTPPVGCSTSPSPSGSRSRRPTIARCSRSRT